MSLRADVTLTCPATWGAARRTLLAEAAARAGLDNVRLVAEPVAAATYFAEVLGRDVPIGSVVVVHDSGAGTFDASVVARTAEGFEVLAVDGRDEIGGLDDRRPAAPPARRTPPRAAAVSRRPESGGPGRPASGPRRRCSRCRSPRRGHAASANPVGGHGPSVGGPRRQMICQRGRPSSPGTQWSSMSSAVTPTAPSGPHKSPSTTGLCTSADGGSEGNAGGVCPGGEGGGDGDGGLGGDGDGGLGGDVDEGLASAAGTGLAIVVAGGSSVVVGATGFSRGGGSGGSAARVDVRRRAPGAVVDGTATGGGNAMLVVGTTIGRPASGSTGPAGGAAGRGCDDPKVTQPITAQSAT